MVTLGPPVPVTRSSQLTRRLTSAGACRAVSSGDLPPQTQSGSGDQHLGADLSPCDWYMPLHKAYTMALHWVRLLKLFKRYGMTAMDQHARWNFRVLPFSKEPSLSCTGRYSVNSSGFFLLCCAFIPSVNCVCMRQWRCPSSDCCWWSHQTVVIAVAFCLTRA